MKKDISKMSLEEIDKELESFQRPNDDTKLYHKKQFLTDTPDSNGFLHASISKDGDGNLDVSFSLADCSRTVHLDMDPFPYVWVASANKEHEFEKHYTAQMAKYDLIIDTLNEMKNIAEQEYDNQQYMYYLACRQKQLQKRKGRTRTTRR